MKHYGKHAVRFMLILALLLQLGACGSTGTVEKTNKTAFVLDTSCTITIYGGSRADNEKLLEGCFALCEEYENLLSTTRETIARTLRQLTLCDGVVRHDRWHCEIRREALLALAGGQAPGAPAAQTA